MMTVTHDTISDTVSSDSFECVDSEISVNSADEDIEVLRVQLKKKKSNWKDRTPLKWSHQECLDDDYRHRTK